MANNEHSLEKQLGEVTLRKNLYERELVSSGIRELDEMMGGGFRPGTSTLIQEDLGAGGLIVLEKIINIQLSLDNKVLIVYTDPTADFFVKRIKNMVFADENLIILDFVQQSKRDVDILFDKHEISLEIADAQQKLMDLMDEEEEDDIAAFVVYLTLNPFVMNLDEKTVTRFLFENMLSNMRNETITLALLQQDIIATDYHARVAALFHAVIDLNSEYSGIQKRNYIRIRKYIGRYFDAKVEPYSINFDVNRNKFNFLIKSAFLTSFDTYRDLLEWQAGTIYLSKVPYLLTPVAYMNMLLEIPMNIDEEKGKEELIEKGMAIGRILTVNTESLYHLTDIDLLKATLRAAALQGYGYMRVIEYHRDENLLIMRQTIHPDFSLKPYKVFLEGFYRGMLKRSLNRKVRSIKYREANKKDEIKKKRKGPAFIISVRLKGNHKGNTKQIPM